MAMSGILIDISEDKIKSLGPDILNILLFDRTTRRNIIWATDNYERYGESYNAKFPITIMQITGDNANIIQPRVIKTKEDQIHRTKQNAEVFTPSWICNIQNNMIDEQWFGKKNVFNLVEHTKWRTITERIIFPEDKLHTWEKYVDEKRLEITCGEAPYLVSRYDSVTGKYIEVEDRIGLLDRKLRIVNENNDDLDNWYKWAKRAFQSIYGFEYQGDNLLLARENILYTFVDNFEKKFNKIPTYDMLKEIAIIISWNIWQMDGITLTVPYQRVYEQYQQLTIDVCKNELVNKKNNKCYCKIKDWRSNKTEYYYSLMKTESE